MAKAKRARFVALVQRVREMYPEIDDPVGPIGGDWVMVDGAIVANPAALVRVDAALKLRQMAPPRGRLKLQAALNVFYLSAEGRIGVDVGASTGGFTRALLDAGVQRVYSIDAGYGQLLGSLRADSRVVNLERVNLANVNRGLIPETVDVITVDLSYLPLADAARQLDVLDIARDADLVALVKPMYELGLSAPPVDELSRHKAVERAIFAFRQHRWRTLETMESPIRGRNGAIEHFVHFRRH